VSEKSRHPLEKTQSNLTKKELEILSYIGMGFTSKEIADKLNVSKRTIDAHRSNLMAKALVSNVVELIN
jgi:DNA-binding NarL/FixJ family response regulator